MKGVTMKKRFISLFLALAMTLSLCVPASAASKSDDSVDIYKSTISYVDSTGKTCYINLTINTKNNIVVTEDSVSKCTFNLKTETVDIKDLLSGTITQRRFELPSRDVAALQATRSTAASIYAGRVNYKTYTAPTGDTYDCSLNIYATKEGSASDEFTVNGEAYDTVSFCVGLVISFFTGAGFAAKLGESIGNGVLSYLIGEGVTYVVDGVIREKFTEKFYTYATYYTLEAIDPELGTSKEFYGEMHKVTHPKTGYKEYYYDGYYPQFLKENDNTVAYWLYTDFWAFNYPGVKKYLPSSNY